MRVEIDKVANRTQSNLLYTAYNTFIHFLGPLESVLCYTLYAITNLYRSYTDTRIVFPKLQHQRGTCCSTLSFVGFYMYYDDDRGAKGTILTYYSD